MWQNDTQEELRSLVILPQAFGSECFAHQLLGLWKESFSIRIPIVRLLHVFLGSIVRPRFNNSSSKSRYLDQLVHYWLEVLDGSVHEGINAHLALLTWGQQK